MSKLALVKDIYDLPCDKVWDNQKTDYFGFIREWFYNGGSRIEWDLIALKNATEKELYHLYLYLIK